MLLFTPLALLFLFLAIDGGLALRERAAIVDALRGGLNSALAVAKERNPIWVSPSLDVEYDQAGLEAMLDEVAKHTNRMLLRAKGTTESGRYRLRLELYRIPIDMGTGAISGAPVELIPVVVPPGPYDGDLPYFEKPAGEFVAEHVERAELPDGSSAYAIPTVNTEVDGAQNRYLASTLVLYGEVVAITNGLHNQLIKDLYDVVYHARDRQVVSLKEQLS